MQKKYTMKNLKKKREEHGMSQEALGFMIDGSQQLISAYENEGKMPSAEHLINIAIALNTSVEYLVGLTDDDSELFIAGDKHITPKDNLHMSYYLELNSEMKKTIDLATKSLFESEKKRKNKS